MVHRVLLAPLLQYKFSIGFFLFCDYSHSITLLNYFILLLFVLQNKMYYNKMLKIDPHKNTERENCW